MLTIFRKFRKWCQTPIVLTLILALVIVSLAVSCARTNTNKQLSNIAPSWIDDATIYEVNIRQYTKEGTFKAFATHLPRLKAMGIRVLWFMPIHPISVKNRKGSLGSYYSVADYKAVNPEFGNLDDFKALVKTSHDMGFKVIMDWVGNHTGWDNPWISEHPDWYIQVGGKIVIPAGTDWTDVAELNYDNQEMRAAMLDAMMFWVKDVDVDGFRCDVANGVPQDFWENTRTELDKIKPVFMLAENSNNFKLLKKAFNANYNWDLLSLMNEAALDAKLSDSVSIDEISTLLHSNESAYPPGSFPMNFTTNHDENSWNGTEFERLGMAANLMTALTFVTPGLPLIYSGQEASNTRRLLFFEKDEIDWSDLKAQDFLQKLILLKKDNPSLDAGRSGGTLTFLEASQKMILAFARNKDENRVVFVGNFSQVPQTFKLENADFAGTYVDYMTGTKVDFSENASLTLAGFGFIILVA